MSKRILIRKFAIPAAIVAGVSIIILLATIPIYNAQYNNHKEEFRKYITSFMDKNTKYLKGIASKIKSSQPDPVLVNELQSEYMIEHQKAGEPKKYLWMSSMTGDFLFGVPSADFQKTNEAFDKYRDRIKADENYRDRNDFLTKLVDKADRVDYSQFERTERPERWEEEDSWRFFKGDNNRSLLQPATTSFSTPVYDAGGKLIGRLFMKVDDRVNEKLYYNEWRFERSDLGDALRIIPTILLVISGIFLWFLLPTWVYVDAKERDVKTPGIWAFLTLISLFFGLTIYLITRPDTLKSSTCPECKGELNGTRAYCPHCGFDLSNNFCQQCQYPIKPEWQYCPDCRSDLKNNKKHRHEISSEEMV
ncbi:MAG: zinc ribbon domain-containing protein [Syntrophomonadaceae bacterium]